MFTTTEKLVLFRDYLENPGILAQLSFQSKIEKCWIFQVG